MMMMIIIIIPPKSLLVPSVLNVQTPNSTTVTKSILKQLICELVRKFVAAHPRKNKLGLRIGWLPVVQLFAIFLKDA
jgi:hypothetical protein